MCGQKTCYRAHPVHGEIACEKAVSLHEHCCEGVNERKTEKGKTSKEKQASYVN